MKPTKSPADYLEPAEPVVEVDGVILPSGTVTYSECAAVLFRRLGEKRALFRRGTHVAEIVPGEGGDTLAIVNPESFRSRAEEAGPLLTQVKVDGEYALKPTRMSRDEACALLGTREVSYLPPIQSVLSCPVIVPSGDGVRVLGPGYHTECGGVFVTGGIDVSGWDALSVEDAASRIRWLVEETDFQSPGDKSRAWAAFITPALRMGGWLTRPIPIDVAEADASQAGKGYRHTLVCAVYGERPYLVAARNGGVGGTDESFAQALVNGRPFIALDNVRGKIDSVNLEAFLTAPGSFAARVPYRGEVQVDPKRFLLQLSSNGVEATRDLANRSAICRIRKRVGFAYRDTRGAVESNPGHYLAAVFRLVAEWVAQGKQRTTDRSHDFVDWAQTLDWIVQHLMGGAPLMDGHKAAQARTCTPALSWLRLVALAVEQDGRLGDQLSASAMVELCRDHDIEVPGGGQDDDKAKQHVGRVLPKVFGEGDRIDVDGFEISRAKVGYRKTCGDLATRWEYTFSRLTTQTTHDHP